MYTFGKPYNAESITAALAVVSLNPTDIFKAPEAFKKEMQRKTWKESLNT
jgi:hypothetical protein